MQLHSVEQKFPVDLLMCALVLLLMSVISQFSSGIQVVCTDILDDIGKQTEAELQQKYGSDHVVYRTCNGASDENVRGRLAASLGPVCVQALQKCAKTRAEM